MDDRQTEIERRLARTEHLLAASPAILYTRDQRQPRALTFISPEVRARLGYDPESLVKEPLKWLSLVHPEDVAGVREKLDALASPGEYRILHADGGYRFIRDDARVTNGGGNGGGATIVGCWLDITKPKETEMMLERLTRRLARSNRELEQFAYVASHDLRAPLRAIDTLSEWLEHDLGDVLQGDAKEQMRLLRGRVRRMDRLLADLLEYARVGRVRIPTEAVDVAELIREVCDLAQLDQSLKVELGSKMPRFFTAKVPLKRVFLNLLNNAAKHNDRPQGHVTVTCSDLGDAFEFEIKDDGPGIPKEFHERVFQMFQTLKPRDATEGSGMGLALVRRIVESASGKIGIRSQEEPGARGTTFTFSWPKDWQDILPTSQANMRAATVAS
jgi:signal transduction histidine kinase